MSKCSVWSTLKSNCSHCTLLRPKYCAWAAGTTRRVRRRTESTNRTATRIDTSTLDEHRTALGCKRRAVDGGARTEGGRTYGQAPPPPAATRRETGRPEGG